VTFVTYFSPYHAPAWRRRLSSKLFKTGRSHLGVGTSLDERLPVDCIERSVSPRNDRILTQSSLFGGVISLAMG
jgi:hypothetical protein